MGFAECSNLPQKSIKCMFFSGNTQAHFVMRTQVFGKGREGGGVTDMKNCRSRFFAQVAGSYKSWIQSMDWRGCCRHQLNFSFLSFSPSLYPLFFFTACKSLLNKKSDSAKVSLPCHISALFCPNTSFTPSLFCLMTSFLLISWFS